VATFGFNENDAKRIGKVVRLAERNPDKPNLGNADYGSRSPGVRLLIAQHTGSSWAVGSTAIVTIYNGAPGAVLSAVTLAAYNHYVNFASDTNCTARWVALGHNGFGWLPVDSQSACGTCVNEVGGVDFRIFPGYTRTNEQVLGHDNVGCIKWFNTTTCATAS
jgi:hypothetical protein